MGAIYVISTKAQASRNRYKVGKHSGTKNKLLSRYRTYLIKPVVYYFEQVKDYTTFERDLLACFDSHRLITDKGSKSEWVTMDLNKILRKISKLQEAYVEASDDSEDQIVLPEPTKHRVRTESGNGLMRMMEHLSNVPYRLSTETRTVVDEASSEQHEDSGTNDTYGVSDDLTAQSTKFCDYFRYAHIVPLGMDPNEYLNVLVNRDALLYGPIIMKAKEERAHYEAITLACSIEVAKINAETERKKAEINLELARLDTDLKRKQIDADAERARNDAETERARIALEERQFAVKEQALKKTK